MKKTLKKNSLVEIYDLLTTAKMAKMQSADKFIVLRIANALKPEATAFKDFVKDVQERLKPEGWDEIIKKSQNFDTLPVAERIEINLAISSYSNAINECVKPEADKDVEVEFTPMTEETLGRFLDSNEGLSVEKAMLIQSTLAE